MNYFKATCLVDAQGKIPLGISQRIREVFAIIPGKQITIKIEEPKKYSTDPQRNYYFGVIVKMFQEYFAEHGQYIDDDELHDMMMKEIGHLWKEEANPFTGELIKKRRSYNSLSTKEAEEYHMKCRAEAASRGFDIPEPNEAPKRSEHPHV